MASFASRIWSTKLPPLDLILNTFLIVCGQWNWTLLPEDGARRPTTSLKVVTLAAARTRLMLCCVKWSKLMSLLCRKYTYVWKWCSIQRLFFFPLRDSHVERNGTFKQVLLELEFTRISESLALEYKKRWILNHQIFNMFYKTNLVSCRAFRGPLFPKQVYWRGLFLPLLTSVRPKPLFWFRTET